MGPVQFSRPLRVAENLVCYRQPTSSPLPAEPFDAMRQTSGDSSTDSFAVKLPMQDKRFVKSWLSHLIGSVSKLEV